ncbi:tryptophan 2,3-dioxygenase [Pseudonocardia eucalypti]|uniref:Tryptophan 2,3-dioxygenase n=2 Tax=Pseudonocardia eucalypti TaxID=648755 RepID=A0ABP9R402_9PSEU
MRTDELLTLQKEPAEMAHRDELLFQTVHQTTELWLKHACFELSTAAGLIAEDDLEAAVLLVRRACLGVELCTDALRMLTHMAPADFQQVAAVLGNGSGLESPGWRGVRAVSGRLGKAFDARLRNDGRPLVALYRDARPTNRLYQLAESLVAWDEAINVWRVRHYTIAVRIRGAKAFGTGGQPVAMLNSLIHRKFFPELWEVRDAVAGT